jgi:transcriptional regulator GlxA family with amidase domain
MMLTMIASQHGPDLASGVAEAVLHSPIRHHSEHQRMSLPARIGARHPKLVGIIEKMEENLEEPLSPRSFGEAGRSFDPPQTRDACSGAMSTARRSATIWNCA